MATTVAHPHVEMTDIRIAYGESVAVDGVSLRIESGEFFTLLGPSGCGKTTLLRAIAGFNRQAAGDIRIGEALVNDLPPYRRDTGMVFQNYAIFPHLSVWDNVAYGLKTRRVPKREISERVREALAMVDLIGYDDRMPKQLSGGQQQRVVVARAIVIQPGVLLMDEPLANLDAKLRIRLREDLRSLQQRLGITTIYVTHDQEEALSISDRIAVMSKGHVLQVGTPEEVYARPSHIAVARFVGEGTFFRAELASSSNRTARLQNGELIRVARTNLPEGAIWLSIRPEDVEFTDERADATFAGAVLDRSYFGPFVQFRIEAEVGQPVLVRAPATAAVLGIAPGDTAMLRVDPDRVAVYSGEEAINV
jgi:ABC-type Fe3+/spermidine/putrescine transport system ATPase subunit